MRVKLCSSLHCLRHSNEKNVWIELNTTPDDPHIQTHISVQFPVLVCVLCLYVFGYSEFQFRILKKFYVILYVLNTAVKPLYVKQISCQTLNHSPCTKIVRIFLKIVQIINWVQKQQKFRITRTCIEKKSTTVYSSHYNFPWNDRKYDRINPNSIWLKMQN